MIQDQERLRRIQANAQLALEQLGPVSGLESFGYNAPSVEWLDGYIERQRENNPTPDFIRNLSSVLGCFLGECIIRTYGGHWSDDKEYGLCVEFDAEDAMLNAVFPFAKVQKQFENGIAGGDSIYSLFNTIPVLLRAQRPENRK